MRVLQHDAAATPADTPASGGCSPVPMEFVRTDGPSPETLFSPSASEQLHQLMSSRLKQCRRWRGLSQSAVASRTGIPRSAISDIERGARRVEALELARFASLYGMPLGHFLGEDFGPDGDDVVRTVAGLAAAMSVADRHRLLDYARLLHTASVAGRTPSSRGSGQGQ